MAVEKEFFRPLRETIEIPLARLQGAGSQASFRAWIDEPATAAGELLLRGVALRLRSGAVDAFCVTCPHEICEIEMVANGDRLPKELGPLPRRPLLACPCHFSVFDPEARGRLLAGPSPRGLYRFALDVVGEFVRIDRIEAAAVDRFVDWDTPREEVLR